MDDLTEEFDIHEQTNKDMHIPKYIGKYYVEKIVEETSNCLLICATYENNKKAAIKCIPPVYFNPYLPDILNKLNHPNILPIYEIFHYPEPEMRFYCIVMPFVETDLFNYFYIDKHGLLNEPDVCQIMEEALSSVSYFHSLGLCHSDLKIENFLVMSPKTQKKIILIDFDYTFELPDGHTIKARPRGTLPNSPPELLQDECLKFKIEAEFTNKIDTWSMGIVLYTLLSGKHPFVNSRNENVYDLDRIKNGDFDLSDRKFPNVSPAARNLIYYMLQPDSNERYTIEDALNHPWFNKFLGNRRTAAPNTRTTTGETNDTATIG